MPPDFGSHWPHLAACARGRNAWVLPRVPVDRVFIGYPKLGMIQPNMGTPIDAVAPRSALADALFPGTKQRVLGLLFGQPWRSFYASELIGMVASGSGAVQRELAAFLNAADP